MAFSPKNFRRSPASFVPSSSVTFYFGIPKAIYNKMHEATKLHLFNYARKHLWEKFGSRYEYEKKRCSLFGMSPVMYRNELAKTAGFKNNYHRKKTRDIKKYGSEMSARDVWAKKYGEKRGLPIKDYYDYREWKAREKGFASFSEYNSHCYAKTQASRAEYNECSNCGVKMKDEEAGKFVNCEACRIKWRENREKGCTARPQAHDLSR